MDLNTTYLGLQLPHPFIAGASPLADQVDTVRRLEDAGAAAVVMRSLFEEQISEEALATYQSTETHAESFGEALSYFPERDDFVIGPQQYLEQLRKLKDAVGIPIIASLNGVTPGGWLEYARHIEQAGADALELNLYNVPTAASEDAGAIERREVAMVGEVRKAVSIPLAVKLSPFYTALVHHAKGLVEAGADGLVLFNRFFEPDVDIEELEVTAHLELSAPAELLLRLRWLAILSGRLETSLAVTGGVHTAHEAVKALMCGANAVQMVSALLREGPRRLSQVRQDLVDWLEANEYDSLDQLRGSMNLARCPDPESYERANYMHTLQTWRP